MKSFLSLFEQEYKSDQLFNIAQTLYKSYDVFMKDEQVWNLLDAVIPSSLIEKTDIYKNTVLGHKIVNDLVYNYYPAELPVKYDFVRKLIKNNDYEVSLFEMYVASSRVDIARINGHSHAYEIKTSLDKLTKLDKQLEDYFKAFEYVSVITAENHLEGVLKTIPENCGVFLYNRKQNNEFKFKQVIKPKKNVKKLDHEVQIDCFSSKDLKIILRHAGYKNKDIPTKKSERRKLIIESFSSKEINNLFKHGVKEKYKDKWDYIRCKFEQIYPIDIQSFFKSMADPKWVYYKNSSTV